MTQSNAAPPQSTATVEYRDQTEAKRTSKLTEMFSDGSAALQFSLNFYRVNKLF